MPGPRFREKKGVPPEAGLVLRLGSTPRCWENPAIPPSPKQGCPARILPTGDAWMGLTSQSHQQDEDEEHQHHAHRSENP